jgi:hypothetical protein
MAIYDYIYTDAGLNTKFDTTLHTLGARAVNGGAPGDGVFYIGHPTETVEAASDPGIDPITVSISDASVGSGVEASAIKLALSSAGLDSATGGAALSAGVTISPGAGNAAAVHYRWTNTTGAGSYTEISLAVVELAGA